MQHNTERDVNLGPGTERYHIIMNAGSWHYLFAWLCALSILYQVMGWVEVLMTPGLSKDIRTILFLNLQITRSDTTHKVCCQPGDCLLSL